MPRFDWPLAVAAALALTGLPAAADDALDAAKADMAATLGPESVQTGVFPDAFAASTWAQTRARATNPSQAGREARMAPR